MLKPFRFHIILFIALVFGAIVLQVLLNSHFKSIEAQNQDRLLKIHSDALIRAEAGIEVYAALVSSIRSHVKNSPEFPSEKQLQSFLKDFIEQTEFNDSIVISFINTNHEFLYVFSSDQIDPAQLKGRNVKEFRAEDEIYRLNQVLQSDEIVLFEPINLYEGWAGFPFNFSVKDINGKTLGYLAPIINVKYFLNYFYAEPDLIFAHSFNVNTKFDITREVVYDSSPIFNDKRDVEYYKNFKIDTEDFISSNLDLFGLNLVVSSAYKKQPEINSPLATISYIWYIGLLCFSIITLIQFFRNHKLNKELELAQGMIEQKNIKLQKRIDQVQTLIQEIHHRIKNNMMIITSLIDMQSNEYEEPKIKDALQQSKNRIQSMSLIHEKLYDSNSLKDIKAIDYIKKLISYIDQTVNYSDRKVKKELNVPLDLRFDGETMMPLGLILNELLTNSYKYAFRPDRTNILKIEVSKTNDGYILNYADNGPGLPDNIDINNTSSLGMELIILLSEELNGSVTYKKDDLSKFEIFFKPKNSKK